MKRVEQQAADIQHLLDHVSPELITEQSLAQTEVACAIFFDQYLVLKERAIARKATMGIFASAAAIGLALVYCRASALSVVIVLLASHLAKVAWLYRAEKKTERAAELLGEQALVVAQSLQNNAWTQPPR